MSRASNRRALGDLGNIISDLPERSSITQKSQQLPYQKYGAVLTKNHLVTQACQNISKENDGNAQRRSKGRRTLPPSKEKSQARENETQIDVPMEEKGGEKLKQLIVDCELSSILPSYNINLNLQGSCEIEMEEADSPIPSIDNADAGNPLAVVDYIEDIYKHYRKTETVSCVHEDYMSRQTDINHRMRAILVDWLIEVHHKFDLMHETLFLAINLIDRYLSVQNVMRKSLQLVGITGMFLASKYEDVYVPALEDFVIICDRAYSREDILKMEKSMLNSLKFNISIPTPFVFMRRFLKAADSDTKLEMVTFYLVELCMVEYRMLKFPPSLLAAAAVYTGRCLLNLSPIWNKTLNHHSTYTKEQLMDCVKLMKETHQNAGVGKFTSVYRKYSVSKYSCVAKLMNHSLQQP